MRQWKHADNATITRKDNDGDSRRDRVSACWSLVVTSAKQECIVNSMYMRKRMFSQISCLFMFECLYAYALTYVGSRSITEIWFLENTDMIAHRDWGSIWNAARHLSINVRTYCQNKFTYFHISIMIMSVATKPERNRADIIMRAVLMMESGTIDIDVGMASLCFRAPPSRRYSPPDNKHPSTENNILSRSADLAIRIDEAYEQKFVQFREKLTITCWIVLTQVFCLPRNTSRTSRLVTAQVRPCYLCIRKSDQSCHARRAQPLSALRTFSIGSAMLVANGTWFHPHLCQLVVHQESGCWKVVPNIVPLVFWWHTLPYKARVDSCCIFAVEDVEIGWTFEEDTIEAEALGLKVRLNAHPLVIDDWHLYSFKIWCLPDNK